MLNIVDKYSVQTPVESEEGIVGIEYVLMGVLAVGLIAAIGGQFGGLATRLGNAITTAIGAG